jgi:hypothetical protein
VQTASQRSVDKNQIAQALTPEYCVQLCEIFQMHSTEGITMNKYVSVALLSVLLATTAGCSNKHAKEIDARLESAENNAASARLRADEAYNKAEQAAQAASQAQRTADEANTRASRMLEKATRK